MGIETALLAGGATLAAGGKISSGIEQNKAAREEARQIGSDADRYAREREQDAIDVAKRQKLSFIKSGIDITPGSPLLMLAETKAKGRREAGFIREKAGRQAKSLKRSGRSALISSLLGAGSTAIKAYGGMQ